MSVVSLADDVMPSRPFWVGRSANRTWPVCYEADQARRLHCKLSRRRISAQQADRLMARGATYIFELNSRWNIDGSPRWNVARYINHSCRPNARPVRRKGIIVALRRIEPGEEITYDYGREYLNYFLDNGGCRCAACQEKASRRRRKQRVRDRRRVSK